MILIPVDEPRRCCGNEPKFDCLEVNCFERKRFSTCVWNTNIKVCRLCLCLFKIRLLLIA